MPLILPSTLPAVQDLAKQGIQVLSPDQANEQDICPLKIGFLNLMPSTVKRRVELQIAHVLHSPLQIRLYPIWFDDFKSESSQPYLDKHYTKISAIQNEGLDGLIITGANLEHIPFEEVQFFQELKKFMYWADNSVTSTIYSCWSAHARLFMDYQCERQVLPEKLSGVFHHRIAKDPLTYRLDDHVAVPHSRNTTILTEHVRKTGLQVLIESPEAGWHLLSDKTYKKIFLQGHPEYDTNKLHEEYLRDKQRDSTTKIPQNYYPHNDVSQDPKNLWSANAGIFFGNWINSIYQKISQLNVGI